MVSMEVGGGMTGGNSRPPQGDPNMKADVGASNNWRSQLQPDIRSRIVTKIVDTIKKHIQKSSPQDIDGFHKIALRLEEKIYSTASSSADYMNKITTKMRKLGQNTYGNGAVNPLSTDSKFVTHSSINAANLIQSQAGNQGPRTDIQMSDQAELKPRLLDQNSQYNLSTAPSDASVINSGQNSNVHSMRSTAQNSGQTADSNSYGNSQRQMQGIQIRQQTISTAQQQQSRNHHQQYQTSKQTLQHWSPFQPGISQQQKQFLPQQIDQHQSSQHQSSQQLLTQTTSSLQPSQVAIQNLRPSIIQPMPHHGLQQNRQNSMTHPAPYANQSQPVFKQQPVISSVQPKTFPTFQQSSAITQQPGLPSQQQKSIQNQESTANMQPQNSNRQQNTVVDLRQQHILQNQKNNLQGMQGPHLMLNQTNILLQPKQEYTSETSIYELEKQSQQLSLQHQHLQNQFLGSQPDVSNMQQLRHPVDMLQKSKASEEEMPQAPAPLLQPQCPSQYHPGQQLNMALQSKSTQVQQQMPMQKQSNSLEQGLQPSSSIDSSAQIAQKNVDLQEEAFRKIQSMRKLYFPQLKEMYQRIISMVQKDEALSVTSTQSAEMLNRYKTTLECFLRLLQTPKGRFKPGLLENLPIVEKRIIFLLNIFRNKRNGPSQPQGQEQVHHPNVHSQSAHGLEPLTGQLNQLQQINLQSSVTPVQSTTILSMQSGPVCVMGESSGPLSQQNMTKFLQPQANLPSSQGNPVSSSQQHSGNSVSSFLQAENGHAHQNAPDAQQQSCINSSMPNNMNSKQSIGISLVSERSSFQVGQKILSAPPKSGTSLQSERPLSVAPPSTALTPSSPGDHHKQIPGIVSLPNSGNIIGVSTPGMSASPLLAECTNVDGYQNNTSAAPGNASAELRPLERLKKAVQSLSPVLLCSAIEDIGSVISMVDRIAGSAPGNGSRAAVGQDLVAMTRCRLQARTLMNQDTGATVKKMKRQINCMPWYGASSFDSWNNSFDQLGPYDSSEMELGATSNFKRFRQEAAHTNLT